MTEHHRFWKLEHLSDAQLLQSLTSVVQTQRRTLAELVAHLGEVEERRLHLEAACSSMFAYCVGRLGMSEDEACRRIDLARLARTFPALFAELESGQITLSVALVLKPILTTDNHRELLSAARGKSTQQARELVAERAPKPDVPSSIRKLPERRPLGTLDLARSSSPAALASVPTLSSEPELASLSSPVSTPASPPPEATSSSLRSEPSSLSAVAEEPPPLPAPRAVPASRSIEPLSAQRYRIQFTADAELKRKLELARDLLRHAHPTGDFAPVVSRALELLLADLQRRRFGAGAQRKSASPVTKAKAASAGANASVQPDVAPPPKASPRSAASDAVRFNNSPSPAAPPTAASPPSPNVTPGPPTSPSPGAPPTAASPPAPSTPPMASASPAPTAASPPAPNIAPTAASSSTPHTAPTASASPAPIIAPISPAPNVTPMAAPPRRSYIPRAARRAVLERGGLGCCWVDARGVRCGSRAWLELDHHHPVGKRGSSEPQNLRLLCRAHNQLAAEHAYGRVHMERARRGARRRAPKTA